MTMPDPLTIHPHEARRLPHGVLLLRPVEPQPVWEQRTPRHVMASGWAWHNGLCAFPKASEFAVSLAGYCPLGAVGDTLETDAGPVTVRSVRVLKIRDTDSGDTKLAGFDLESRIPAGWLRPETPETVDALRWPRLSLKHWWSTAFPAQPWESAWAWVVEVEKVCSPE